MGDKSLVTSRVGAFDDKSAPWSSAKWRYNTFICPVTLQEQLIEIYCF